MSTLKRSEIVRSKKKRRLIPSKRKARRMDMASAPNMPPIKTRINSGNATRSPYTQTAEMKRKINWTMGNSGAEMEMPGIPKIQIGWRFISAILAITIVWSIYLLWNNPNFKITDIQINGLKNLTPYELNLIMDIQNKPIFMIDIFSIEENIINTFPAITEIDIQVDYPANIIVSVKERLPALVWKQDGIMDWWVDLEGIRFAALTTEENMIVVHASAPPPQLFIDVDEDIEGIYSESVDEDQAQNTQLLSPEMIDAILSLFINAPENSILIYDETHGLGWNDLEMNWKVFLGHHPDQMETRLLIYETIRKQFEGNAIKPILISIEYIHAPYYRLEEYIEVEESKNEMEISTTNEGEN